MRPEKESMVDEMRSYVAGSEFVFLVDPSGLNVQRVSELRDKLRGVGAEFHVVKNRLLKFIAKELEWKELAGTLLGPTAVIAGNDELAAAKILKEFMATDKRPVIKAGMERNTFLPASEIEAIAVLPPLQVIRATLAGTLALAMRGLAGVMNQKLLSVVYVLKAAVSDS